jgi:leucyl/phenylalanyl-tRNA--protein transferase
MSRSRASWSGIDLSDAAADGPVAFCADTGPDSLLAAYRAGAYPFPTADEYARTVNEIGYAAEVAAGLTWLVGPDAGDPYSVSWWSPDPRPVLDVDGVHLSRSLARRLRRAGWVTTLDREFERVVRECRVGRDPQWLTDGLLDSLLRLHGAGWAHSAEVWEEGTLVGGVFGVRIGSVLSMDSMFHRRPGASVAAVADLGERFAEAGGSVLDAQWDSPHIRGMGARLLPRERYLRLLSEQPPDPGPLPADARPAGRLAGRLAGRTVSD